MFAAATVFAYGCSDNFDDSALWKDIDGMYKSLNELKAQVTTMQQQLDALAAVVSGGAVTSITQDADGHYVLSYKDADNVEHTIDIATMDDANTQPIIGMKADGGIIITASHNPRQWNALKLLNSDGEFLNDAEGKQVLAMSEEEDYDYPAIDAIGHVLSREDFNDEHIRRVLALPLVDVEAVRKRRFKVVVDAVNSVGGIVMPKLLRELGCEVVELNCEPTGEFAHNPEPLPQNLTEISEVIVREKADLGIVVDPDVDRLAFVSEDGSMFVEEYTLVAVADYILSEKPGNTVSNLSSSRALRDVTERHGGKYSASAVGEVNVVAKMKETGAVIGGEGNGGVIYPELHYGRDALVGTALFLTWLAHKGMTMTQLRATYPSYFASKNKIELTPAIDVDKVLREIKERYAGENMNDIDGVKIDFAENWVHLRKSNTEPIIRVYTEAKSMAEADALAQRFIGEIKEICNI